MPKSKARNRAANSSADADVGRPFPEVFSNPITIVADMNATFLEGFVTAQKEWADFVQRRTREDVAVTRQLMNCRSFADMHQIYGRQPSTNTASSRKKLFSAAKAWRSILLKLPKRA